MLKLEIDHNLDSTSHVISEITKDEKRLKNVRHVKVGFFSAARYDEGSRPFVASVAMWQEFQGVRNRNKPARPFMREAIKQSKKGVLKEFRHFPDHPNRTLNRIGLLVQKTIQKSISGHYKSWAPLAQSTVNRRRKQSSQPLLDTGYMRSSVTYKVD